MKSISCFIVICFFSLRLSAQSEFQVTGGLSLPINNYADLDNKNTKSGFAGQGYVARFALFMLNDASINPFVQFGSNYNPLRTDEKDNYLDSGFTISSVSSYKQHFLGLGLRLNPWKLNKISPFLEGSIGAAFNSTPEYYTFDPIQNKSTPTRAISSSDVYLSFAYGIHISLSKNTRLVLGSGLWYTPGTYNNDVTLPVQVQLFYAGVNFNLTTLQNP